MKTMIILSAIFLLQSSCKKENSPITLDSRIEFIVRDELGNNLLDPSIPSSFIENKVKIFYLTNGQKEEVFYPNYDHPRNFWFFEKSGEFQMSLSPNSSIDEEFPITYIQWNESDCDTIKCSFSRTSNSVICTKVWYNDSLVWDNYSDKRFFEFIKKNL